MDDRSSRQWKMRQKLKEQKAKIEMIQISK